MAGMIGLVVTVPLKWDLGMQVSAFGVKHFRVFDILHLHVHRACLDSYEYGATTHNQTHECIFPYTHKGNDTIEFTDRQNTFTHQAGNSVMKYWKTPVCDHYTSNIIIYSSSCAYENPGKTDSITEAQNISHVHFLTVSMLIYVSYVLTVNCVNHWTHTHTITKKLWAPCRQQTRVSRCVCDTHTHNYHQGTHSHINFLVHLFLFCCLTQASFADCFSVHALVVLEVDEPRKHWCKHFGNRSTMMGNGGWMEWKGEWVKSVRGG